MKVIFDNLKVGDKIQDQYDILIVESIDKSDQSAKVKFAEGHSSIFTKSYLENYFSLMETKKQTFKIGDKVKLSKSSVYFSQADNGQGESYIGEIIKESSTNDYTKITWENGKTDNYPISDLYLAENTQKTASNNCQDVYCNHANKKVVQLVYTKYLYCPDCKLDMGDC